jgi:drug/metabolite transporter (DMT)-like permease
LHVIIINYLTASITGFSAGKLPDDIVGIVNSDWFYISLILGVLFVLMFIIIGYSTKHAGITVTSIGTKMSVVIPVLFSIIYYHENIHLIKVTGIILAIISIIMATVKGGQGKPDFRFFIFPFSLFVGMGIVDSLVKFNQEEHLKHTGAIESSAVVFTIAFIFGLMVQSLGKNKSILKINAETFLYGIALGLANFGSLYFMILALNSNFTDSSVIFAVNNLSIIILSAISGKLFFKEKLSKLNWAGVLSSLLAIVLLSASF